MASFARRSASRLPSRSVCCIENHSSSRDPAVLRLRVQLLQSRILTLYSPRICFTISSESLTLSALAPVLDGVVQCGQEPAVLGNIVGLVPEVLAEARATLCPAWSVMTTP